MKSKIAIAALLLLPISGQYAMAEEAATEEKSSVTVSAELGMLYTTGNTKSGDLKLGLNVKHEEAQWLNTVAFSALAKKSEQENAATGEDDFETTDNRWDITGQSNYSIEADGKNYLYGSAYYEQDKFSGFKYQTSASVGWGRHWIDNETSSFFADIGPGIKYDVLRATPTTVEDSETAAIIQAQALYTNQINDFVEFKQYFVAKQALESDKNSTYKSETSLTTKLIDSLQFKFAFRVDYDTEVEEDFENTNTETSATLIYSF
ncbi:DUF481 domain-containing protein [Colwellia sp. E2M01]|uniref:DUF481 domain-containing protein n=1 Tax=Colwellia sp. E2M01 TaxID=2841561 RepID=UPI001C0A175B|nr:DUF481 domain-containing protein [Colwellia sp. E2M01]MBU2869403.1 DUF481 domain-containing protein [Colwellia sp. E2M01]